MVAATSSAVRPHSTASVPSAISSPAPGPTIPTPSSRPDSGSAMSLVRPSARPSVAARPEAAHWNFATFTARPARDGLGGDLALAHGPVRKHRLAGHITDRVDPRIAGAAALLDGDEPPRVGLHLCHLEPQALGLRTTPDGDQHPIEGRGGLPQAR